MLIREVKEETDVFVFLGHFRYPALQQICIRNLTRSRHFTVNGSHISDSRPLRDLDCVQFGPGITFRFEMPTVPISTQLAYRSQILSPRSGVSFSEDTINSLISSQSEEQNRFVPLNSSVTQEDVSTEDDFNEHVHVSLESPSAMDVYRSEEEEESGSQSESLAEDLPAFPPSLYSDSNISESTELQGSIINHSSIYGEDCDGDDALDSSLHSEDLDDSEDDYHDAEDDSGSDEDKEDARYGPRVVVPPSPLQSSPPRHHPPQQRSSPQNSSSRPLKRSPAKPSSKAASLDLAASAAYFTRNLGDRSSRHSKHAKDVKLTSNSDEEADYFASERNCECRPSERDLAFKRLEKQIDACHKGIFDLPDSPIRSTSSARPKKRTHRGGRELCRRVVTLKSITEFEKRRENHKRKHWQDAARR